MPHKPEHVATEIVEALEVEVYEKAKSAKLTLKDLNGHPSTIIQVGNFHAVFPLLREYVAVTSHPAEDREALGEAAAKDSDDLQKVYFGYP